MELRLGLASGADSGAMEVGSDALFSLALGKDA